MTEPTTEPCPGVFSYGGINVNHGHCRGCPAQDRLGEAESARSYERTGVDASPGPLPPEHAAQLATDAWKNASGPHDELLKEAEGRVQREMGPSGMHYGDDLVPKLLAALRAQIEQTKTWQRISELTGYQEQIGRKRQLTDPYIGAHLRMKKLIVALRTELAEATATLTELAPYRSPAFCDCGYRERAAGIVDEWIADHEDQGKILEELAVEVEADMDAFHISKPLEGPEPLRRIATLPLPEGDHHSKLIVPGPLPVPPGTEVVIYPAGHAPTGVTREAVRDDALAHGASREGIYSALMSYAEVHPDWTGWAMAEDLWEAHTVCVLPDSLRVQDVAAVIQEAVTVEGDDMEFDVSAAADGVWSLLHPQSAQTKGDGNG